MLTLTGAASLVGCSPDTIRRASLAGRLPFVATPLGRLFDPDDVRCWREEWSGGTRTPRT